MIPPLTSDSGRSFVGMKMNGVSDAADDEPQPGMPHATNGSQWNERGSSRTSDSIV